MLSFLTSKLGRGLIGAVGIAVVLGGTYLMGRGNGHANGLIEGRKAGYESRNEEVAHLTDNVIALSNLIDTERKVEFQKIQDIQATAANAAVRTEERLGRQIRARDQVIANYSKVIPISVQQQCGLTIETVRAINQLIDKVNGEQNETGKAGAADDSGKAAGDSASNSHSADADGVRPQPEAEEAAGRRGVGPESR